MRPIRTTSAIGLFAAGAMLVAACGGNSATTAPTSAPATTAPITAAPTTAPATDAPAATTNPGATLDLSSFHGDANLESLLPKSVGGENLTVLSMTGDQFLTGPAASPELQKAITALGKTPADLSVAFGGNTSVSIVAFRLKGVGADVLFNAFKQSQTGAFTADSVSYGGKSVTKITPSDGSGIAFIYVKDDAMFVVGGTGDTPPSDALLNEAFQKLP